MRNFDKYFELKEQVTKIIQIKYSHQALFHAKIYTNLSDGQQLSNMSDLSDLIGENDFYEMKSKVVKLSAIIVNLDKQLTRSPKPNDKKPTKIQIKKVRNS